MDMWKIMIMSEVKKIATYNLSEETIKKLEQIMIAEIIATGKMQSKSSVLRDMIIEKWERIKKS